MKYLKSTFAAVVVSAHVFGSASARDLIEVKTPYFTVLSALTEADTRDRIEELRTFQAVVAAFSTVKELSPRAPFHIYLVNSSDWEKYLRPSRFVTGYMSARPLSFAAALDSQGWTDGNGREILFHEYAHFILRNADSDAYPGWFEEGLAELLSTVKATRTKVLVGLPPLDRLESLDLPGGARWVPLQQVLSARPNIYETDEKTADTLGVYVVAWALMHYLVFEHPNGTQSLNQYLSAVRQGASIEDTFKKAFGMSIGEMDTFLKGYTHRTGYKNLNTEPGKLPLPPVGNTVVRQLSRSESAFELGQLMMRVTTKAEQIPAYFDGLLKSDPKNARLIASKANALALIKEYDKAEVLLKQALELAPTDQRVLILAGDIQTLRLRDVTDATERKQHRKRSFDYYHAALSEPYSDLEELEVAVRYAELALEFDANLERPLVRVARLRGTYPNEPLSAAVQARLLTKLQRPAEARVAWQVVAKHGDGALKAEALQALGLK